MLFRGKIPRTILQLCLLLPSLPSSVRCSSRYSWLLVMKVYCPLGQLFVNDNFSNCSTVDIVDCAGVRKCFMNKKLENTFPSTISSFSIFFNSQFLCTKPGHTITSLNTVNILCQFFFLTVSKLQLIGTDRKSVV